MSNKALTGNQISKYMLSSFIARSKDVDNWVKLFGDTRNHGAWKDGDKVYFACGGMEFPSDGLKGEGETGYEAVIDYCQKMQAKYREAQSGMIDAQERLDDAWRALGLI